MSPFDAALWILVAALALYAGVLTLPRPVRFDWERLFKLVIVTVLRGEAERAGGEAEDWLEAGRTVVLYNPAARLLIDKITDPAGHDIPVPALAGERGLVEDLQKLDDLPARLDRTFGARWGADEALYDDPQTMGSEWALDRLLGPGVGWDAVAAWSEPLVTLLQRRLGATRWAVVAPEASPAVTGLVEALTAALAQRPVEPVFTADPAAVIEALEQVAPQHADRVVIIAIDRSAPALLRALHEAPALRDRCRAHVLLSARFDDADRAWMGESFTHPGMDTELSRTTPYFEVAFIDPEAEPLGEPGLPLADTRLVRPPPHPSGRVSIEVVDVGPLRGRLADARPELLAKGLAVLVAARLTLEG